MVEGAICAAIAIVFNLLFAYVPFMGIILNLIMPLPLVVCGMRNGMRWSIMAAVVSTVLVAMTVNPIHALFYIGVYGVMGIVLGEAVCIYRGAGQHRDQHAAGPVCDGYPSCGYDVPVAGRRHPANGGIV